MRRIAFVHLEGCYVRSVQRNSILPLAIMRDARVFEVCESATQSGVQCGQTLRQGRLCCPELVAVEYDQVFFNLVCRSYLNLFINYASAIEPVEPHQFFLDLSGAGASEKELRELLECIVPERAISVRVGMASCKLLAHAAAKQKIENAQSIQINVLSTSEEESFLFNLPVKDFLLLSEKTRCRLLMLGIQTVGQLVAIAPGEIIRRFEDEGKQLLAFLQGQYVNPVQPLYPEETIICKWEAEGADGLSLAGGLRVLDILTSRLATDLQRQGVAARQIVLLLEHENKAPTVLHRERNRPYGQARAIYDSLYPRLQKIWTDDVAKLQLIANSLVRVKRKQAELISSVAEPNHHERQCQLEKTLLNLSLRYKEKMVDRGWPGQMDRREAMLRFYDPMRFLKQERR